METTETIAKYREIWFCETCEKAGRVEPGEQETDVMSVLYLIEEDHIKESPECTESVRKIRVVNFDYPDWKSALPQWAATKVDQLLAN